MNLSMFMNSPMIKAIRFSNNPYGELEKISRTANMPMLNNVLNVIKNGDQSQLESIARNLCKERGINIDELMSQNNLR